MDPVLGYAVIGGLFEPVWVYFLARSGREEGNRRILMLALFLVTSIVSVYWVGLSMRYVNIGVAYAVWTAVGAVATLAVGRFAFGEDVGRRKVLAAALIIAGIAGLRMFGGIA